jgi:hypothetical protein
MASPAEPAGCCERHAPSWEVRIDAAQSLSAQCTQFIRSAVPRCSAIISDAAPFDATLFYTALSLFLSAPLQKLRTYASKIKECAPAGEEYPTNMAKRQKTSLRLKLTGLVRAFDSFEGASAVKPCLTRNSPYGCTQSVWSCLFAEPYSQNVASLLPPGSRI